MALIENSVLKPIRLGFIEGDVGKKNEIIYHPSKCPNPEACVVFFGGDIQDYEENMLKHRDNKHYVQWHLENTCCLLHQAFPNEVVFIVKPSKMSLMTFSCFENFAEVNNFGAPTYSFATYPLKHLKALLFNAGEQLKTIHKSDSDSRNPVLAENIPVILVGFSKGSVVLNQFLYSFSALNSNGDEDLKLFVDRISDMYWLEGGHSGTSETWVTKKVVLENFASLMKNVHIHVTPYQVFCDTRPRIGKEEKIFRDTLVRLGCNVKRRLHFQDEPRSLENHLQVLKVFHH